MVKLSWVCKFLFCFLLTVDARSHRPAADDPGSYLLLKPGALSASNSDYMAMPAVLKSSGAEAVSASDTDRSSKLSVSSHPAASDYMEMAARAVRSSKTVCEPGNKKASDVSTRKLSTGSRGTNESGSRNVSEVSSKKSSTESRPDDGYMSFQPSNVEASYVDMKNAAQRSAGWL